MAIDMLILLMFDFDIVLSINWLNKYHVVVDYFNAFISFEINGALITHELVKLRLLSMLTMEFWEKPMVAALSVKEKRLTVWFQ